MIMTKDIEKQFYKVAEVAQLFGIHSRTVLRWIADGIFPNARKLNPKAKNSHFVIPKSDVESLIDGDKNEG